MLHPQTQAQLDVVNDQSGPEWYEMPIEQARIVMRDFIRQVDIPTPSIARVLELDGPEADGLVTLHLYDPLQSNGSPPATAQMTNDKQLNAIGMRHEKSIRTVYL